MIELQRDGEIAVLTFRHEKRLNPFSLAMTRQLTALCAEVERDDAVAGVLVWGGEGRSFSVGGDFRDIRSLATPEAFEAYLHDIVDSYVALLSVTKPVVAAVDGHAIGQGLQVALMADWRVGGGRSVYQMPELANGVPCPLGATILDAFFGRAAMLHLVVGCASLEAGDARATGLIDELADDVGAAGRARLVALCEYPRTPFRLTKRIANQGLVERLRAVAPDAARAHAQSFFEGAADAHFDEILEKDR